MIPLFLECREKIDLGVLMDFSNTMTDADFKKAQDFIVSLAKYFDISYLNSHFSYLPYHTVPIMFENGKNWFANDYIVNINSSADAEEYVQFVVSEPPKLPENSSFIGGKHFVLTYTNFGYASP